MKKVVLTLVDGMRPDALKQINHPFINKILEHSAYTFEARTVVPAVTLPCHMSLFHSVPPERHGITTNYFTPQVRPVPGLCEVLSERDKLCSFFYDWSELRDCTRPGSLMYEVDYSMWRYGNMEADRLLTVDAIDKIGKYGFDFTFFYLGALDEYGHHCGWMSDEYMECLYKSIDNFEQVVNTLSDDYLVILTADHGGHLRGHGDDIPEDMNIPVIFYNPAFEKRELKNISILDIAPTVANVIGVPSHRDWEGKAIEL